MFNVWISKCIPRSLEAEKYKHKSTVNGGRRNRNVSGLSSFLQIFQGVMPDTDFFIPSGKYPPSSTK